MGQTAFNNMLLLMKIYFAVVLLESIFYLDAEIYFLCYYLIYLPKYE